MFGYYNDTQRRNDTHLDILKEEVIDRPLRGPEWCDWSSALCVEDDCSGLALLRESHRCVNQVGHACGHFYCDPDTGLEATGWGVLPQEIAADRYRAGWATWCLVYGPTDVDRQLTFKRFDRIRYPTDPDRDIYIMANTWGSCGQRHNPEPEREIRLHFLEEVPLEFEDLVTGDKTTVAADPEGRIPLHIDSPADFRFVRYTF
jgi:hypothetical protein